MKKSIYTVIGMLGLCRICEGMYPTLVSSDLSKAGTKHPHTSEPFYASKIRKYELSDSVILVISNEFYKKIRPDDISAADLAILSQAPQEDNPENLSTSEETAVDEIKTTAGLLSIAKIIEEIIADTGPIYSVSQEEICNGGARENMLKKLNELENKLTEYILKGDDKNNQEQWLDVLREEIDDLDLEILYAYDELPGYSHEQIQNHISYYRSAKDELQKIIMLITEGGR